MSAKVLLADDSSTIQKVIKITLANEKYDLLECTSEKDLIPKVIANKPDLILLDFNLSASKTGYELTVAIKEAFPPARVLLMFGTFDSVDETALISCGASDKVIKPFDSSRFVEICRTLVEEVSSPQPKRSTLLESIDMADGWVMEGSDGSADLDDWDGMSVPGVIDRIAISSDLVGDIPPVIGNGARFPDEDDLDYPDIEVERPSSVQPKSKLVSLSDLSPLEDDNYMSSAGDQHIDREDELEKLELEIEEEKSIDELWAVDSEVEEEDFPEIIPEIIVDQKQVADAVEEMVDNFVPADFDVDRFKVEVKEMVEDMVKKYCRETIEKVAWEVIPDLAENLIKKELAKVSQSVMEQ